MSPPTQLAILLPLATLLLATTPFLAYAQHTAPNDTTAGDNVCADLAVDGDCQSVPKALRMKLIAIPALIVSAMIGACLPLFSRALPALGPDRNLFILVKAFASGVILGSGYLHILPEAFRNLTSRCLPEKPWQEFPFTTFVAMIAAVFALMVNSLMLTFYNRNKGGGGNTSGQRAGAVVASLESPVHEDNVAEEAAVAAKPEDGEEEAIKVQMRRNRVVVQVIPSTCSVPSSAAYILLKPLSKRIHIRTR